MEVALRDVANGGGGGGEDGGKKEDRRHLENESRRQAPPSFLPACAGSDHARPQAIEKTSGSYCRVNIKKTHKQRTKKRYQNTKQIRGGKRKGYPLRRIDTV